MAATIAVPIVLHYTNHDVEYINYSYYNKARRYSKDNNFVEYDTKDDKDMISVANSADINLFATVATAPFNNLMRLSLLAKTQVHFYPVFGDK